MKFIFIDDSGNLEVDDTTDGLIKGLQFKADHIRAKVDPQFFALAAHKLNIIADNINTLEKIVK